MLKAYETPENEPVPPECRATVDRIQDALDGVGVDALDADPHATACSACRERVRAARVLLSVLATPSGPVTVPDGFANRVVEAMKAERYARTWRRNFVVAVSALAASVLLIFGLNALTQPPKPKPEKNGLLAMTPDQPREVAPPPREKAPAPEPAPEPRPIRFGDAVANTSQAILDTPKPFAGSVAVAPKVLDVLTSPFKLPAPPADPMGAALEPARKSLAEIPIAARTGLEPVTGTAEKAFARFLRDMGSVKPNS